MAKNNRLLPFLLDIDALLARNRTLFGAIRMDGAGGGAGDGGTGAAGGSGDGGGGAGDGGAGAGGSGGTGASDGEHGFPENTPLEQMTSPQREAYWKHQSRKHEDRVKAVGGITPEKLKELQDKAKKHDDLEREAMSDKEKAVTEAKETAERDTTNKYAPKLVKTAFRGELKGRVPDNQLDERLATITGPLDLTHFLNADGDVDTDKVAKFVEGIAPATGNGTTARRGPTATGHGSGSGTNGSSGATGREMYEQRHKKSTNA